MVSFFSLAADVLLFLPGLAVSIRRLHDLAHSAWLMTFYGGDRLRLCHSHMVRCAAREGASFCRHHYVHNAVRLFHPVRNARSQRLWRSTRLAGC
ncbi:hypothetical protein [Methylocystis parvus]|uniref:hypothetical protein n=1 Tax=Methylocystis parvus TaxID=134 RepID=UPI003C77EF6C